MIVIFVKGEFVKRGSKIINYTDYRKFDTDGFRKDLEDSFLRQNQQASTSYDVFDAIALSVLKKYFQMKKKSIKADDKPFMTKALRKAIINRTCLRNKYKKYGLDDNKTAFRKQRDLCLKILREAKQKYFKN